MNRREFRELWIAPERTLHEALEALNRTARGILLVVRADGVLQRTLTDGDLRRAALQHVDEQTPIAQLAHGAPVTVPDTAPLAQAVALMDRHQIDHVPVVDAQGRPVDLVHRRELTTRVWLSTPHLSDEERAFVDDAFRSNWIAPLGPHVDAFEQEIASQAGVQHAAALVSGTAAIHLGLLLLGVQPGDTVFCSSLTFVGSCNPILYCGARPVFIDSEPGTWNMSPQALATAFEWAKREGRLPKCVIVVSLYGQAADMDALLPLCREYGVPVLEDAAESLGALYKGRPSGGLGDLGVYSFNGNKIITTSGGGMLVGHDAALIARARKLSTQAREPAVHYEHKEVGFNYRMSNVLAGIGRGQLKVLGERVSSRRAVFEAYRQRLADCAGFEWMPEPEGYFSTRWLSCLVLQGADAAQRRSLLLNRLERHSIDARPVWKPMHLQPLYREAPYFPHAPGDDVSARLFHGGLCLPSSSSLTPAEQDRVVDQLRWFLEHA